MLWYFAAIPFIAFGVGLIYLIVKQGKVHLAIDEDLIAETDIELDESDLTAELKQEKSVTDNPEIIASPTTRIKEAKFYGGGSILLKVSLLKPSKGEGVKMIEEIKEVKVSKS